MSKDQKILRRSVNVFDETSGHHTYDAGTKEGEIPEEHLEQITNPKAWVSYETLDEDFGLIPEGFTREDFVRAAAANSDVSGEEPVRDDDEADDGDLSKMTVPELHALAAEEGIELGDATKKADIVQAITDARD
jgi:hypothetical protein